VTFNKKSPEKPGRFTRLVVAHRPETLRAAGRVITLEGGVAREASAMSK
jgi:ABC-type multidrug transport system fused ATPase/permease subunit